MFYDARRWRGLGLAGLRADWSAGGLAADLALYGLSACFAAATAAWSTLAPHRAWGAVAFWAYALATLAVLAQLARRRAAGLDRWTGPAARAGLAGATWLGTGMLPLVIEAAQRSAGRPDRAQEEVLVIEDGARRLLETGTPYLDRAAIAALPPGERLLGYLPYQPGMAALGLPRALDPAALWFSDARVWFALVAVVAVAGALVLLRRHGAPVGASVRSVQALAVLPLATLTLATGGDDLPVLALCLLALALAATGRLGWSGLAAGAAGALKLFAWPVAAVLAAHALARGRAELARFGLPALLVAAATAAPSLLVSPAAMVENVLAFPSGHGLVTSPAASPLPGYLLASSVPGGRWIALGLLLAAGVASGVVLWRRPPGTVAAVSAACGLGLLTALLLLPATRFGYLLYPVAFLAWTGAFRVPTFGGTLTRAAGSRRHTGVSYANRDHAGDVLAGRLSAYANRSDVVVLGLVRGGVPVAARVAAALHAPLDVLVVRKLGVPWAPEVAFGALGPGGVVVHNPDVESHLAADDIARVIASAADELTRREAAYRGDRPPLSLNGRVAVIVDDGLATGATARAAVAVARKLGAVRVVVAVPVGADDSVALLRAEADEVVCPLMPEYFGAVSRFYQSFPQTRDDEVVKLLAAAST